MNVIHCGYDGKSAMTFITAAGSALMTMLDRLSSVTAHTLLVPSARSGVSDKHADDVQRGRNDGDDRRRSSGNDQGLRLGGQPPGPMRSSKSGSPRAPSRNFRPHVGQASSSNDTISPHVQGQPTGGAAGSSVPEVAGRRRACAAASSGDREGSADVAPAA